jgi:hypothetical protein
MQLALDHDTNDLIKGATGGVERVTDGRYTVQAVRSKLKTNLGDWVLDPSIGWLNYTDFKKGYDLFDIEDRAREIILQTQGVEAIDTIDLIVHQRKLTLTFSARTIYGVINLTIPWGN